MKNEITTNIFQINKSFFIKNEVWDQGGAIYLDNTNINFFGCVFFSNKAQFGGAIFLNSQSN